MSHTRTHIILPEALLSDVDTLVGPRGRSAFVTEVIREAVDRRKLLAFLTNDQSALKEEDYPEFRDGAEKWVRNLRDQDNLLEQEKVGRSAKSGS